MVEDMQVRNFSNSTIDSYTWHVDKFCQYFGKRPKKLPMVLSDHEAAKLIECVENTKHRAVLLTCYAVGLRLSEATHLKVTDIDGQRQQIRITEGKGRKDRIVNDKNGQVTLMARSKDKRAGNPMKPVELSGREFVRRWAMHHQNQRPHRMTKPPATADHRRSSVQSVRPR
ncbi:MAG TPA: hypothetical protein DCF63_16880 [Planctomycetaceae bacterium]|nr:hypothetical protein [Planctomycetaceae bacterium]